MEWSEAEEDGRRFNLFLTSSLKDLAFFSILDPEAFSKKNKINNTRIFEY